MFISSTNELFECIAKSKTTHTSSSYREVRSCLSVLLNRKQPIQEGKNPEKKEGLSVLLNRKQPIPEISTQSTTLV